MVELWDLVIGIFINISVIKIFFLFGLYMIGVMGCFVVSSWYVIGCIYCIENVVMVY